MRKIIFTILLCGLLMVCAGAAAEEAWITIEQMPGEGCRAPYYISGSTNLPTGNLIQFNITSLVNGAKQTGTVLVTERNDGMPTTSHYWQISSWLTDFPPGPCTVTVTGMPRSRGGSAAAGFSLSKLWIKIDPIPFVTAEMDNVTFSGTTTLPSGQRLLVEMVNSDATACGGTIYGRSATVTIQNGTGDVQTWSWSTNTTGLPAKEYTIHVNGIETDVALWEEVMIYPAGYTTPGPTKSSGFGIVPILIAGTAALILMRKQ